MAKSSKFVKMGAMIAGKEKDAQGRTQYYLKLDKDVKLLVNGKELASDTVAIERPTDKYDRMVASGKMTPEEYDSKVAIFEDGGKASFVKFEFTARLKD